MTIIEIPESAAPPPIGDFTEYESYDGLGLAELVKTRQVSAAELVDAAITRIERHNPRLNAVVGTMPDSARQEARQSDSQGPFAGVPFLLEDVMTCCAGAPLTNGSRFFRDFTADHDCELTARYRRAGLILLGRTNAPEFGLWPVTEPKAFGPTLNPWNLRLTPGGSAGGSAVAVASGMAPMAHAGDGGGSIRIPSSCCGLFGLKPTRGRNPIGPRRGEAWHGAVVEHVITRSVRDSAAMLDATAGPDCGAPYYAPPPDRSFLASAGTPPRRLRIAVSHTAVNGAKVHADCRAALAAAAALCADLGHIVEEATPRVPQENFLKSFLMIVVAETAAEIECATEMVGRRPKRGELETVTTLLGLLGHRYSAAELAMAVRRMHALCRSVGPFFNTYDVLLTPTLASPPLPIGALQARGIEALGQDIGARLRAGRLVKAARALEIAANRIFSFTPFTPIWNITGQPAMSVPLHWNRDNVPIGVQFVGRYGDEATLFSLASQLEQAQPWQNRRPQLTAA